MHRNTPLRRGFSLIELVIVVVIIGVIAAIAIPRMSRGARGAQEGAIEGNLAVLRNAIDLYSAEHGGAFPSLVNIPAALTTYSNFQGGLSATAASTHPYGPYVRKIPPMPLGNNQGDTNFAAPATNPPVAEVVAGDVAWLYDAATGEVWANATGYFDK